MQSLKAQIVVLSHISGYSWISFLSTRTAPSPLFNFFVKKPISSCITQAEK